MASEPKLNPKPQPRHNASGDLIDRLKEIDDYGMQAFWEQDYDGHCPCFRGKKKVGDKWVTVQARCWRVSDNIGEGYQDLIVGGSVSPEIKKQIAQEVKRALDKQEWYNPYKVEIESTPKQAEENQ